MYIVIESFIARGEPSCSLIRARPYPGQGLSAYLRIECSKSMRCNHPVGTLFKVWAEWKSKQGGLPFLYASYRARYEVLDREQAISFIKATMRQRHRAQPEIRA